jgi:hypothetical protein
MTLPAGLFGKGVSAVGHQATPEELSPSQIMDGVEPEAPVAALPDEKPIESLPEPEVNDRAFYTAALSGEGKATFMEKYEQVRFDMGTYGASPDFDEAVLTWQGEQEETTRQAMLDIIQDPSIPVQVKKAIVVGYNRTGYVSSSLRDRYATKIAAEDLSENEKDGRMMDKYIENINARIAVQEQIAATRNEFFADQAGEVSDFLISAARDTVVPGTFIGASMYLSNAVAEWYGGSIPDHVKATITGLAAGSTNEQIHKIFVNTLNPEERKSFLDFMLNKIRELPGATGFDRWALAMAAFPEEEAHWGERTFENVIGALDAFWVGKAIKHPVNYFKWLSTFEKGALGQKLIDKWGNIKHPTPQPIPPSAVQDAVALRDAKASNPPTGTDIVVRDKTLEGELVNELPSPYPTAGAKQVTPDTPRADISDADVVEDVGFKLRKEPPVGTARSMAGLPEDAPFEDVLAALNRNTPEEHIKFVPPSTDPGSPLGTAYTVNPAKGAEMAKAAAMDEQLARAMGTTPGEVWGGFVLPKLDDDFVKNYPGVAAELRKMDSKINDLFEETKLDPFLVDTTERATDKAKLYQAFKEASGPTYQQANSSFRESLGEIEGKARYGSNEHHGFETIEDAIAAERQIKEQFPDAGTHTYKTNVVQDNGGQWYVDMDWKKEYDPFSAREFGFESTDTRFLGRDASWIGKSFLGKWIFPSTHRLPEWATKGAWSPSVTSLRVEEQFAKIVKNEIRTTTLPKHVQEIANYILENQKYMDEGDIAARWPELNKTQRDELIRKQAFIKRVTDYKYNWANRAETSFLKSQGQQGIYNDAGDFLTYGKAVEDVPKDISQVWDFTLEAGVKNPGKGEGWQVVHLRDPKTVGNTIYEYAIVGGKTKLDILPERNLPYIHGWIGRENVEHFYIKAVPKSATINGNKTVDPDTLVKYMRTIGAARNEADGNRLIAKLQADFPEYNLSVVPERGDTGDAIITDYKVYKEHAETGKKRGERLPTIDGHSRLEDALVSLGKDMATMSRLDAWKDYEAIFQKNFIKAFKDMLPGGEMPNVMTDIKPPVLQTKENMDRFKAALRLFEGYTNSKYKINTGDEVWKYMGHKVADILGDFKVHGGADWARKQANKGDMIAKGSKSLANNLLINLNFLPQILVQGQKNLEFAMMEPRFAKEMHMLPALYLRIVSKASEGKPYEGWIKSVADHIKIGDQADFDALVEAIYKSGIPQGVDLNMMLHGGLRNLQEPLVKGLTGQTVDTAWDAVRLPGQVGKAIGYTPAQMMADMGGFLYARVRWQKLNPGKDWNTPSNIRQIAADSWDIMGSMSTRAGAMPYQDGYLSLVTQFGTIVHKQLMEVFSSKSYKKAPGEFVDPKVKLAAARMAIYGASGVPGGMLITHLVDEYATEDMKDLYDKLKGGLLNALTNLTVDIATGSTGSDLDLASRIGPLSGTHPMVDFLWEMSSFALGDKKAENPRFPFVNATGAVYEAAKDIKNLFAVKDYDTAEGLAMVLGEIAEVAAQTNNINKAMMIMELGDKKDRLKKNLGLELSYKHAVAQMFGIVSEKELALWRAKQFTRDHTEYVSERVTELHEQLLKMKDKIGTPDYMEWERRVGILNAATPKEVRGQVYEGLRKKDRDHYENTGESVILYLRDHYQDIDNTNLTNAAREIKKVNPEFYKLLQTEKMIPKDAE